MAAETRQRRTMTAREAAEHFGVSPRTIRRVAAEPREDFLARAAARRDEAVKLRYDGLKYQAIADAMGCTIGTVSRLLHDARKLGVPLPARTGTVKPNPAASNTQDAPERAR
jgi:transposase